MREMLELASPHLRRKLNPPLGSTLYFAVEWQGSLGAARPVAGLGGAREVVVRGNTLRWRQRHHRSQPSQHNIYFY